MIDERLPDPWPEDVLLAVRRFRQGYLVLDPPFFYARSEAHQVWRLTVEPDDAAPDESIVDLGADERPRYGLITTQTCDLYEEGRPRQPWFSIAPVYDYESSLRDGQLGQLDRGQMVHLVHVTAAWLPAGVWVADLRLEIPVEKGWLVGREPSDGFATPKEYNTLAARLASRRGRPAISPLLTSCLTQPLRDWLGGGGRRHRDEIRSFRLWAAGDLATATAGGLIVIAEGGGLSPEVARAWTAWEAGIIDAAADRGATIIAARHGTSDDFSARDIEDSVRLDFDYLSPDEG